MCCAHIMTRNHIKNYLFAIRHTNTYKLNEKHEKKNWHKQLAN